MQDITRRDIVITVAVIIVLLGSVVGWFAFKHHKATTPKATLSGVYKGWATDNASIVGISFNYPTSWTDVNSHSTCTGALLVTITPSVSEIAAANVGPQYYLEVEKYGTENANCDQDGTNLRTRSFNAIDSSDQLQNGLFKKDWLTFFNGGNNSYTTTKADTAVVTPNEYNGSQTAFTSSDTLSSKGATYQISIETSTTETQSETPNTINMQTFKATQLYKDTLNIFNSIQKD